MENIVVLIAAIYATIAAVSVRKLGLLTALLWPISIMIIGTMVFLSILMTEPPQD